MGQLTEETGQRVNEVTGSAVSGVGYRLLSSLYNQPQSRPSVADMTSEEAFEQFKEYNVNTNLNAATNRMWAGLIDKISTSILTGVTTGLVFAAVGGAGGPITAALGGAAIFVAALTATLVSFAFLHQTATKDVTAKHMDVQDYHIRRGAALVAKELQKSLSHEGLEARIAEKPAAHGVAGAPDAPDPSRIRTVQYEGQQMESPSKQIH